MLKKIIMLSGVFLCSQAVAAESAAVKELKKGMPVEVASLISRIVECNYWRGEDTSTKARAEKVNQSLQKFQCDTVEKDQAAVTKTYQNNYEIKSRIQKAQEIF